MKKLIYIFATIVALGFTACDNEVNLPVDRNASKTDLVEYLTISDNDKLVEILNQLDEGRNIKDILNVSDFYSMWDIYTEIINSSEKAQNELIAQYPSVVVMDYEDEEYTLNLADKTLAKLLSPEGLIKVGEKIVQMDGDVVKSIDNGDITLIDDLKATTLNCTNENIFVSKIVSYKQSGDFDEVKMRANAHEWSGNIYYFDDRKRCRWVKYLNYNVIFNYIDVGAEIKQQKKNVIGVWGGQKTNLWLEVTSNYLYSWDAYIYGGLLGAQGWVKGKSDNSKSLEVKNRYSSRSTIQAGHIQIKFTFDGHGPYYR